MQERLARKFREQQDFAAEYAPLYARYFEVLAKWLEAEDAGYDPLVQWLLTIAEDVQPIKVTLLLIAGLHKEVLAGRLPELALYFPTAGGERPFDGPDFEAALREAILARRALLTPFIQETQVQTNETGRGLCWLLPLALTGWEQVHLLDLGASAGLNLLADQRHFQLLDSDTGLPLLELGRGQFPQFQSQASGAPPDLPQHIKPLPHILSRTGGDLNPFSLDEEENALMLMSFVWGEHTGRMDRLREGIRARQFLEQPPVLLSLDLPEGLDAFLRDHFNKLTDPVVIYNTVMTFYLSDRGESMRERIGQWAAGQSAPVLWLQWEPDPTNEPPRPYLMAWTVDRWHQGEHLQQRIGWAHPHGTEVYFEDDFAASRVFDTIQASSSEH